MLFRVYLLGMIQQTEYIKRHAHIKVTGKKIQKKKKKSLFLMLVAFLSDFKH